MMDIKAAKLRENELRPGGGCAVGQPRIGSTFSAESQSLPMECVRVAGDFRSGRTTQYYQLSTLAVESDRAVDGGASSSPPGTNAIAFLRRSLGGFHMGCDQCISPFAVLLAYSSSVSCIKSYTAPATRRRDTPTQLEKLGDETPDEPPVEILWGLLLGNQTCHPPCPFPLDIFPDPERAVVRRGSGDNVAVRQSGDARDLRPSRRRQAIDAFVRLDAGATPSPCARAASGGTDRSTRPTP